MSIKIPIEAAFNKGNVDQVLQDFQRQLNKLGQQVAQANKVKFNPVERTTVDDLRKVTASFENLRRVSGDLNRRMRATGQQGSGFLDLDWSKLYPDERSRARQMHKAYSYVVGQQFQPGSGGGGGGGGNWGGAGRSVVSSGLNATGPVGGVVNNAISAGMSGGMGAGLAGLVGGIAALALGKAIGAVMEKVGQAQQNAIGYDTLKRTLGDVNVSFNALQASVRASAAALDVNFEESRKLSMQFVKLSGMTAEQYKTLSEEVSTSGGFGRSFGLDPSQSNAFFAQMRQNKITTNSRESKELALMIGESVAKAGVTAKTDEVLESISGFIAQQTRSGMNAANVSGYAEMLTGLMGAGRAGLDPSSAAALIGRVNSSIAGGGSAGEAGQNFLYTAIGSRLGLTPIQAKIMQEQGAFGTGRAAFGNDSNYARYSGRNLGAGDSDVTNLQLVMDHIKKISNGNKDLDADKLANLFGINISQAMALSSISPQLLGGLSGRLKRLGINVNDVNATGISRISQIEADGSLSEGQKDQQIGALARENQEKTQGSEIRAGLAGVENATERAASLLLTPLNSIRDGIMFMAGDGKMSARQITERMAKFEAEEAAAQLKAKRASENAALGTGFAASQAAGQKYMGALKAGAKGLSESDVDAIYKGFGTMGAGPGPSGRSYGSLSGGTLFDRLLQQESGGRHVDGKGNIVTSSKGARGIAQLMPGTASSPGFGIAPARDDSEGENRRVGREYLAAMLSRYNGDQQKALAAYNAGFSKVDAAVSKGGANWLAYMPAETRNYVPSILSGSGGTPLPAGVGAPGGAGGKVDVGVSGHFTLSLPNGQPAAAPIQTSGYVNKPNPSGLQR